MNGATLEPTEAQLHYAKCICDELNVDEPVKFTRRCYSDFIMKYKNQLYNERVKLRTSNQFIFF